MFAAFSTALSALDANGVAVDVVGNNLANMNTTGYKESVSDFRDLVNECINGGTTQLGFGVQSPLTIREFSQGAIETSDGPLDAAIQGSGFFIVNNNGATQYTRAGNFQVDANGNLLTPTGEQVQGWMANAGVVNTGGPIGNIIVPVGSTAPPVATQNVTLSANFNAAATVWSAQDTSSGWSAPITVYDSLGTSHVLTFNFENAGNNQWNYTITMPGSDVQGGVPGTPSQVASGTLAFNADGTFDAANSTPPGNQVVIPAITLSNGANPLNVNWNIDNANGTGVLTQFDQPSAASANTQDGSAASELTGVTMGNGGQLLASYSNGNQAVVGQLALANINNPQTLLDVGNNEYQVSATTAQPAIGLPGTGGRGTIVGGALESSNVDMATELTDLIVLQSAYQANSKVVTTVSTLAQDTTQLIT